MLLDLSTLGEPEGCFELEPAPEPAPEPERETEPDFFSFWNFSTSSTVLLDLTALGGMGETEGCLNFGGDPTFRGDFGGVVNFGGSPIFMGDLGGVVSKSTGSNLVIFKVENLRPPLEEGGFSTES